jgi:heme exporter protein C
MFDRLASPTRFAAFAARAQGWLAGAAVLLILAGLYFAFFASPPDYQQGEAVRIMYIHVPSAWMALFAYGFVALMSAVGLIWRHPLAHVLAIAAAPVGAAFTLVCLITGSLWGKPMWGAWWVWDARLTSVLILFFIYLGYIALVGAFDEPTRGDRAGAILALVGAVNVPIIKFSVDWWNTLHQPASVMKLSGPAIDTAMLIPLLLMAAGFTVLFFALVLVRARAELLARRVRALRLIEARAETGAAEVRA